MIASMVRFNSALVTAVIIAWPGISLAGTTGVVSGHVYDDNWRVLSGATVWVVALRDRDEMTSDVRVTTHESFSRMSDSHGFFVFPSLAPGFYLIESSMSGREDLCPWRLIVDADQTTYVNVRMVTHVFNLGCPARPYVYPIAERLPLQQRNR